jgi:hypothetical protein
MRTLVISATTVFALYGVFTACRPQQQADPSAYPPQPTMTAPSPTAPPTGPAPTYTAPAPTYTAPAPSGPQMVVPGPLALPCSNDQGCGTHRCNPQYNKCAFPCATETDCINPNACTSGMCVPRTGQ